MANTKQTQFSTSSIFKTTFSSKISFNESNIATHLN